MSAITFTLNLPQWLGQWLIFKCGGTSPVRLPKGSVESILVQRFCCRKSESSAPDISREGDIEICFPQNKAKPAEIWSHLPGSAKELLTRYIREHFDMCLYNDIVKPLFPTMLKTDLIWAWMEQNGIETTEANFWAVDKRFCRLRSRMLASRRVSNARKKTSES